MAGQLLMWHGHTAGSFPLPLIPLNIPLSWRPPDTPDLAKQANGPCSLLAVFLFAAAESQPWALKEGGYVCLAQGISSTWRGPGRDLALMNIGCMGRPGDDAEGTGPQPEVRRK